MGKKYLRFPSVLSTQVPQTFEFICLKQLVLKNLKALKNNNTLIMLLQVHIMSTSTGEQTKSYQVILALGCPSSLQVKVSNYSTRYP